MKTLTIVGGGSSTHTLIPLLSKTELKVNLLTSKPNKWSKEIELQHVLPSKEIVAKMYGTINKVSDNPKDVIPESDVVILCMPVNQYRNSLNNIAPFIDKDKKMFIGTVYGQGGFNWMVEEIIDKYSLLNKTIFAFGLIPWICRVKEYGKIGITYGCKAVNVAAVTPVKDFEVLNNLFFNDICYEWFNKGKFVQADNFISLTLSVDNQIIHTSRLYGLFLEDGGKWDHEKEVPYFYRDYTENSAQLLKDLDNDYSLIRNKIKEIFTEKRFSYMLDYLALEHSFNKSSCSNILESFTESEKLGAIKTPVIINEGKWTIDDKHRFFHDDIYYGLCIAKWMAEKLDINVPHIDAIIEWAQTVLEDSIIENKKLTIDNEKMAANKFKYGIPSVYGYTELSQIID